MRGTSLSVHVSSPTYTDLTVPSFVQHLTAHTPDSSKLTKYVDVSAVLSGKEVRIAIVNRSDVDEFEVPILFGPGPGISAEWPEIKVYEVWSEGLRDGNSFQEEKVKTVEKAVKFNGSYRLKKHSFQGTLSIPFRLFT